MIIANSSEHFTPQFRVLSETQCQDLYAATLECLSRVGVQVHNPAARELLASCGAGVQGDIVRIPEALVKQALASAPREFTVWGREAGPPMHVVPDRVHFGPGPTCTNFMDPQTGERRKARRGDPGMTARVCDALPNIDFIMGLSLCDDVTPELASVYEFAEEVANSTKPVLAWANTPDTFLDIYQMAVVAAGGEDELRRRPSFGYFTTYESPLRLADAPMTNLMQAAERGIPVICLGGPCVGLEAPFSGASALVIHLASALAALCVVQSHVPGAPMAIGSVPSMMDLRTARPAYGSPETSLHSAAAVDLARYLGVPFMGTAGASEAKRVDSQAGAEAALQVMLSALSGAALVHDAGFLDCADYGSLPYLVLVDEIIAMAARVMRGVLVSPETIMLDLIEKVGPGGLFLNQGRSASLSRREAWVPAVLDRNPYVIWESKGMPSTEKLAAEKVRYILETHVPAALPDGVQEEFESILVSAEAREKGS
jgi:trimethylamine---corrinoid protein Co-methyltransferase